MKRVVIFEGPDGGGKTTLAHALSREWASALFTHCGAFTNVNERPLVDLYRAAAAPALDGVCDVLLDRSWLSEVPYGDAFRGGYYRLTHEDVVALEQELIDRVKPLVVLCLPPLETCLATFRGRPREEYLRSQEQLAHVYSGYLKLRTALPVLRYDYTDPAWDLARVTRKINQGVSR